MIVAKASAMAYGVQALIVAIRWRGRAPLATCPLAISVNALRSVARRAGRLPPVVADSRRAGGLPPWDEGTPCRRGLSRPRPRHRSRQRFVQARAPRTSANPGSIVASKARVCGASARTRLRWRLLEPSRPAVVGEEIDHGAEKLVLVIVCQSVSPVVGID